MFEPILMCFFFSFSSVSVGDCYQHSGKAFNLVGLSIMPMPYAHNPIANCIQLRGFHEQR